MKPKPFGFPNIGIAGRRWPDPRPVKIVITPMDASAAGLAAFGATSAAPEYDVWLLTIDLQAAKRAGIARLLAFFAVNDAFPILAPGFFPAKAASMVMLGNHDLMSSRGRTFPSWALAEVDRLSTQLMQQHAAYLDGFERTLRYDPPAEFVRLPEGFIFTDDPPSHTRLAPPLPRLDVDLSESPAIRDRLRRDQLARLDYRRDRYMRHLSLDALAGRARAVGDNLFIISETGQVSSPDSPVSHYWWQLFAELLEELFIRYGGALPRDVYDRVLMRMIPQWMTRERLEQRRILVPPTGLARPYLVKYGKRQFLEPALESGTIRVLPASCYRDPSLDPARFDDELAATVDAAPHAFAVPGGLRDLAPARSGLRRTVTKRITTDYYVFCASLTFGTRFMHDFDADCALVIRDPGAFVDRLDAAMRPSVAGWQRYASNVEYYDPMHVSPAEISVLTWKHFRLAYQEEFRVAWVPPKGSYSPAPVCVSLGPLGDICELVGPELAKPA